MLGLLKKRKTEVIFWNDAEIPAKVFFEVMLEGKLELLGNAPEEKLEAVFDKIFDEYITLDGNEKVLNWYKKRETVSRLASKIELIELLLYRILFIELTTKERLELIDKLNSIEDKPATDYSPATYLVKFSKDKPILDEVKRVQDVVLGSLKTRINIEIASEKKQGENIKYVFENDLVDIENVLGRTIDDDVTLKKFISLKHSANKKVQAQKKPLKNGR